MATVPTLEQKFMEVAPDIAVHGPSKELAEYIGIAEKELDLLLGQAASRELVEASRAELAWLLAHRLFLTVPKAMAKLDEAVDKGSIRAIENVLDRAGFPRATRSDVRTGSLDSRSRVDFSQYIEQAGGNLDQVEKGLEQMKADAVEGEWREGDEE
jgi:hypothetical protein